jgi:hypothetical protein
MTSDLLAVESRGIERIVIVLISGLCIWLGYRLFQSLPTLRSDGVLDVPGFKLTLWKVGPGVFFALFGCFVLWQSVKSAVSVSTDVTDNNGHVEHRETFGAPSGGKQSEEQVRADVAVLNCLQLATGTGLDPNETKAALSRFRIALMGANWQPAWGGRDVFDDLSHGQIKQGPVADVYRARHPTCKLEHIK